MPLAALRRLIDRRPRLSLAVYWAVLATLTHWPRLDITRGHNDLAGGIFQWDKLFHGILFGGLAWLLARARPSFTASRTLDALIALLVASGYALLDEYTQGWAQRHTAAGDVVASLFGIAAAVVLWLTPKRSDVTGPRTWRILLTRLTWLLAAPTLIAVTLLRSAGQHITPFIDWLTDDRRYRDKAAHFVLSMLLTWLLAAAAPAGRRRPRFGALLTVLVMAGSAPIIELAQRQTGRGFEVADVFWHQSGVLVALWGWALTLILWRWVGPSERTPLPADAAQASPHGVARAAGRGFVGHAVVVSALTFLSRITGLVRDAVLAAAFGLGPVADAFFLGFLVPNLFRRLFGEGALSAAFIPHYTELLKKDRDAARAFATLCLTLLTLLLCAITFLGEVALWALLQWPGWDEHTALALWLTMVMLPYMPLICLVALIGGVLQVHDRFGPPAAAPVVLNLVMIAATLWATWEVTADAALSHAAVAVGVSVVVAGVLQLGWQAIDLLRVAPLRFRFAGTGPAFRGTMAMLLPMLMGLAVFQINAFLDSGIAFVLSQKLAGPDAATWFGVTFAFPMDAGAVAALQWAQRLYQFPLGVFGIAIATAIFPALAAAAGGEPGPANPRAAGDAFARILRQGLRLTVFIGLPATVGLIVLRLPIARVVYERGAFTFDDAQRVASILAGYSASVWAYSMTHVLTRGFYALKDSKTPLRVSLSMVGFNLALNLTLIWPLGAAGLAWSTAISAAVQCALLVLAIRRRVDRPIDRYVLEGWARTAGLSAAMGVALWVTLRWVDVPTLDPWATAGWLAALVLGGAAIYFAGAWLTGAEELAWLKRRRRKPA